MITESLSISERLPEQNITLNPCARPRIAALSSNPRACLFECHSKTVVSRKVRRHASLSQVVISMLCQRSTSHRKMGHYRLLIISVAGQAGGRGSMLHSNTVSSALDVLSLLPDPLTTPHKPSWPPPPYILTKSARNKTIILYFNWYNGTWNIDALCSNIDFKSGEVPFEKMHLCFGGATVWSECFHVAPLLCRSLARYLGFVQY